MAAPPCSFDEPSTAGMGTSWAPGADQLLSDSSGGSCFTHSGPQQPAAQPNAAGRRVKRALLLEERLQGHMDKEDQRVKQLTESLLYDFLPAALSAVLPPCEDPLQGLDAARCRAVAVATLALSSLLNAPPGFLEFLLCIPWHELATLYPRKDCVDKLLAHLQVSGQACQGLLAAVVGARHVHCVKGPRHLGFTQRGIALLGNNP